MSENSKEENIEGMETEEVEGVTFKFKTAEGHKSVLSNHTWGGFQSGGLFELNFMLEHKPIPKEVTNEVSETGLGEEIDREGPGEFVRENQVTVYMSIQSLLSHYNWIKDKIEELEEAGIISRGEG